ncbi:60S ribosomal protein L31 [Candidatus Woesearchaeota archaeon]|nr:60S ribosomal protein L31 [Candidatus Woesearchaeota archaeon]
MADERIYTVPLRKGFLKAPNYDRTRKAVVVLRKFLEKHTKKEVKIGKYLNLELWKDGRKHPPGKIKVRVEDGKDFVIAELIDAPREVKKVEKEEIKKPKVDIGKIAEEIKDEGKEDTKKAITNIPEKKERVKESGIEEKKHAHRKQEEVITEKTGQTKSRTS